MIFTSKVLLFGEHTLIKGSKGLLTPYGKFYGELTFDRSLNFDKIQNLIDYFENSPLIKENLAIDEIKKDVLKGLSFKSTIPQGQGLGSSGALTAALLHTYGKNLPKNKNYTQDELSLLKDILALMESFYHGTSSGMDPLVSYVGKPLLIEEKNKITQLENLTTLKDYNVFLFSTNTERKASPLIYRFLEMCHKEEISKADLDEMILTVNDCIHSYLTYDEVLLYNQFQKLSKLQFMHLEEMIPEKLHKTWFKSFEDKNFSLKICGAGGGGYFLGMAPKNSDLSPLLSHGPIHIL